MAPKAPHFQATAKHVIFLFLNGGPSQVDTFDPKPMLQKYSGQPIPRQPGDRTQDGQPARLAFAFRHCGKSGIEISEIFPKLGDSIDDVCVIRSMYTEIPNHEPSLFLMNCGTSRAGPSVDGFLADLWPGLGKPESARLCGLCPGYPIVGAQLWSSTFLPGDLPGHLHSEQREDSRQTDQLHPQSVDAAAGTAPRARSAAPVESDRRKARRRGRQLESSIQAAEIAYRMQSEAPEVFDITKEPEAVRARYGDHDFGRGCLMARRLVENGVRMVQVYYGNGQPWDNHDDILIHRKLAHDVDGPIAALLADLKVQRPAEGNAGDHRRRIRPHAGA